MSESLGELPGAEERKWAKFCHFAGLLNLIICIPFGGPILTLILWQVKKGEGAFVDDQGREAMNFQITVFAVGIVAGVLSMVLGALPLIGLIFTFVLWGVMMVVGLGALVLNIMAGLKADEGVQYRYPFALRLL